MTDEVQSQTTTTTNTDSTIPPQSLSETVINEGKLFANKFKTVEDLEKAYGNSVTAMVEKARLEKEIEKFKPPEKYELPSDITFPEHHVEELVTIAKASEMTQLQFEKTVREMHNRTIASRQAQEQYYTERKTSIGEEKMNLLNDYVDKYYPPYAKEVMLDKLIRDDNAMSDALKDRDNRLNNQAPGISQGRSGVPERYDGENDLKAAALAAQKNPRDHKARERYVNLAREVGHARKR